MWGIPFVDKLFVNDPWKFTGTFLNCPLGVFDRHVLSPCLEKHGAKLWIHIRVASAIFRGERDFFGKATEYLASLSVSGTFFPFDGRPFTVSGHF